MATQVLDSKQLSAGSTVTSGRQLGAAQWAFVRAWAEGIDPAVAWSRFMQLDGRGDAHRARRELLRLREALQRVARLHGRPDIAALLGRDPESMVERASPSPTLDAFRQGFDEDFYTEAELLSMYESQYGKPDARGSARRRQRLRERLLQALQWLQDRATRPPRPTDETRLWLDPRVVRRLSTAGVQTIGELHARVSERGFHWHRGIPRLGPLGAARLVHWLHEHRTSLGALPARVFLPPRRQPPPPRLPDASGVVPIERLALPDDARNGRAGSNRADPRQCRLSAADDLTAVRAWLGSLSNEHTARAYRKEAERLLLWSLFVRGKALSSLDAGDCGAYLAFLAEPDAAWVAPRATPRHSPAWRPFAGPLAPRSRVLAQAVLRTMYEWLVAEAYLRCNPWAQSPRMPSPAQHHAAGPALQRSDWQHLQSWAQQRPPSPARARLELLLHLTGLAGLRRSECVGARLADLAAPVPGTSSPRWSLRVRGPRGRWRKLELPPPVAQALEAHLRSRGIAPQAYGEHPQWPLLARLDDAAGSIGGSRLYAILKSSLRRCADVLSPDQAPSAARIRRGSAQALRTCSAGLPRASEGTREPAG